MTLKLNEIDHDILKALAALYEDNMLPMSKALTKILQTSQPGITCKSVSVRMRRLHKHNLVTGEDRGLMRRAIYWQITRTGWLTILPDSDKAPKEQIKMKVKWDETVSQYKITSTKVV